MSHKVHPKSFRIKGIEDWGSRGFYEKKFASLLKEDIKIREYLWSKIGKLGLARIEIERFQGKINIVISTARPGLIIGRGGGGVEELKKDLEKILEEKPSSALASAGKSELKIEIKEIRNPWASAVLVAQWMVGQIEKRVRFRRVLKQALEKSMAQKEVKGIRVQVAGRLDGVEISRREWLKKGRLPRQTLRADIDYAKDRAYCTYGVVGIKVWIYKGEKF